jgi:tRNA threonylcarbamoyl adenosine modification protein (Sua5/YciO/YrdC/YwlC family)
LSDILKLTGDTEQDLLAINEVIQVVKSGQLAVIPTDTSYAVIADAFHPGAIALMRLAKRQTPEIPIPVATATIEMANGVANFSNLATDLVNVFWPGPLTLLTRSQASLSWPICDHRTALSIRVPDYEKAKQILSAIGPVAMTGAQLAGQSSVQNVELALSALGDRVAVYLDAGNLAHNVSTVVDATTSNLRLLRQGSITLEQIRQINPNVIDATGAK